MGVKDARRRCAVPHLQGPVRHLLHRRRSLAVVQQRREMARDSSPCEMFVTKGQVIHARRKDERRWPSGGGFTREEDTSGVFDVRHTGGIILASINSSVFPVTLKTGAFRRRHVWWQANGTARGTKVRRPNTPKASAAEHRNRKENRRISRDESPHRL